MELIFYGALLIAIVMLIFLSLGGDYRKKASSNVAKVSTTRTKIKFPDRRVAKRVEVKWPVTIETGKGPINGETMNVSISGAFICCQNPLSAKETFRLTMNPPHHQAIIATAKVVWSNSNVQESEISNRGMGVCFLGISIEDRQLISEAAADHHH